MKLLAHYLNTLANSRPEIVNWRENYLNDSLYYSYRSTCYTRESYPSSLHYHDYYELVIIEDGDIHYICEGASFQPRPGDIILISPRKLHMSVINAEKTLYKRHVFYLFPDALHSLGCHALTEFLNGSASEHTFLTLSPADKRSLLSLLAKLEQTLSTDSDRERALSLGLIIGIFYYLSGAQIQETIAKTQLPQSVMDIKQFVDVNFTQIKSVSQIAEHFFYSREYIARLFRQHFNTTITDYITKRRIARSQELIAGGESLVEACYQVGFGSMAAFIRAFRAITGMTPSQYRAATKEIQASNACV